MQFSQRLQKLMDKNELSNYRLAKEIDVTDGMIGRWLRGDSIPRGENIEKLVKYFGVSADYLIGNSDNTTPDLPHEEYREVISENGIKVFLDASAKISEQDLKEVVEFLRFKQRGFGH